jgi:hypothetical protein
MHMTLSSLLPQGQSGRLQKCTERVKKIDNRKNDEKGDILKIKMRDT